MILILSNLLLTNHFLESSEFLFHFHDLQDVLRSFNNLSKKYNCQLEECGINFLYKLWYQLSWKYFFLRFVLYGRYNTFKKDIKQLYCKFQS